MDDPVRLTLIKILHTVIWLFFNLVIFYFLYAVIVDKIDIWVWLSLGAIGLEAVILTVFNQMCPVTVVARKYSDSQKDNFDIYLPNWLARYNKVIYSAIVFITVIILIYRLLT